MEYKNDEQAVAARHALQRFKIMSSHTMKRITSAIAIFRGLVLFITFVLITYGKNILMVGGKGEVLG